VRNGDLRVAYRTSREGPRDIVFVPNWFTCCELLPENPSLQGWVEAALFAREQVVNYSRAIHLVA
jgi:hypothetical protein